jgi:hypothetical protein
VFNKFSDWIFKYNAEKGDHKKMTTNVYVKAMIERVKERHVFNHVDQKRTLQNIFSNNPPTLNNEQRQDLLKISKEGQTRMGTYIRQYVLDPPTEIRQKRQRRKLKTFTKVKSTIRSQQSKVSRLTKMTKSLASRLQQTGQFYDRVLEFPLAICDEFGKMRGRHKSSFKDALLQFQSMAPMFCTSVPFDLSNKTEVIIDALKFVHNPLATTVITYGEFAQALYSNIVERHGFSRGASCVTLVFDKPDFLPKIRNAIHQERKKGSNTSFTCPSKISDNDSVPHGLQYAEALTDPKYKALLLDYITVSFTVFAKRNLTGPTQLIIDCPTYGQHPHAVTLGSSIPLPNRQNNKGEADCGVWFHARCSDCPQVLIHAGDTDIYVYGIALADMGSFPNKDVAVERILNKDYVKINQAVTSLQQMPELQHLHNDNQIGISLLAVYLLSGSDYLSGFLAHLGELMESYTSDLVNSMKKGPRCSGGTKCCRRSPSFAFWAVYSSKIGAPFLNK